MWGWILFFLTWIVIFATASDETETVPVGYQNGPPEEKFVITTFEKNVCKDSTNQTFVWKTVESVKKD